MNANDLIDPKKAAAFIQEMEAPQLTEYIKKRLKGISILPPLITHSDEMPAYFLEKVYEQSENEEFKSRFRNAIARLLAEEQIEISDADYLAALFLFCERYIISEAVAPVGGMALSEKLKGIQSCDGDLHRRALMALARMPQGLNMTDIWVNAIADSRYTAAAFAALRSQGLDTILKYLPKFICMSIDFTGSLDLKLAVKTLYEEFCNYSEEEITKLIANVAINETQRIKDKIFTILKSLGKRATSGSEVKVQVSTENVLVYKKNSDLIRKLTRNENELSLNGSADILGWGMVWQKHGNIQRAIKYVNMFLSLNKQKPSDVERCYC